MVGAAAANLVSVGAPPPISQAGELRSRRIESLRAVAALAVLVGHVFAISLAFHGIFDGYKNRVLLGGGLGVFLFFTLSGYLLYWPFVRHAFGDRGIDLRRYALNRALRILPLYWTVVAVLVALYPTGAARGDWWRYALFIENFSPRTSSRLDSPMWSLVVEIQFYAALPLLAWLIARLARRSLRRAALVIAALAAGSFALRYANVIHPRAPDYFGAFTGRFSLPTLFFFFSTGMLLALLRFAWQASPPAWLGACFASPDTWILASVPLWLISCWRFSWEPATALASFLVVAGCVLAPGPGRLVRVLEWRPLAVLGLASYSLYLWHVPIILRLAGAKMVFAPTGASQDLGRAHDFKGLLVVALPIC